MLGYLYFIARTIGKYTGGRYGLRLRKALKELKTLYHINHGFLHHRPVKNLASLSQALDQIISEVYLLFPGVTNAEIVLYNSQRENLLASLRSGNSNIKQNGKRVIIKLANVELGYLQVSFNGDETLSSFQEEVFNHLSHEITLALVNSCFTQALLSEKARSDQMMKAKTGFLANLSHEVRGPIGFMINAVELLEEGLYGEVNDDQKELYGMMKRNSGHLLDLMNDVLDFAKAESGKTTPIRVHLDLNELLKDMIGVVKKGAQDKGHRLVLIPHPNNSTVVADKRHLRQILINLLTNAIKYTKNGGKIDLWAETTDEGYVKINVKDNGVGIAKADRQKVFDPFERLDNSYSLAQPGSGIGMSLTKKLVELNGGSIDFASSVGKGTHFWIELPETAEVPYDDAKQETRSEIDGNGVKVLLYAQDEEEKHLFKKYLQSKRFSIFEVQSVQGLRYLLEQDRFQVAIIGSHDSSGEVDDITGIIRNFKSYVIPTITISNEGMVWDYKKFLRPGVDKHLLRPLQIDAVGDMLVTMSSDSYLEHLPKATLGVDQIIKSRAQSMARTNSIETSQLSRRKR